MAPVEVGITTNTGVPPRKGITCALVGKLWFDEHFVNGAGAQRRPGLRPVPCAHRAGTMPARLAQHICFQWVVVAPATERVKPLEGDSNSEHRMQTIQGGRMSPSETTSPDRDVEAADHPPSDTATPCGWWSSKARLGVLSGACAIALLVWVVTTLVTATRGFDLSDEGYYLLSYRWWSQNLRTFTGSQYFYGPVFQALGNDIAALRVFRLASILLVTASFGWSFMRWLRQRRPHATASKLWEVSGTLAVVCCGGMAYSWLPLSPGYNDVALLGSLVLAAAVLWIAADADMGHRTQPWVPLLAGSAIVAMLLSKWASAGAAIPVLGLVGLAVYWRQGRRQVLRVILWTFAGSVGTLLLLQIFVVPLQQAIPLLVSTNEMAAATANAPARLLPMYLDSAAGLLGPLAVQNSLLFVAAAIAPFCKEKSARRIALALVLLAFGFSAWIALSKNQLSGGAQNLVGFSSPIFVELIVALVLGMVIALEPRLRTLGFSPMGNAVEPPVEAPADDQRSAWPALAQDAWRTWLVIAMLTLLPLLQGIGSNNPLYFMAVNGFAFWAATIVFVLTGALGAPVAARVLAGALAASAVATSCLIASNSLWYNPYYRNPPSASATSTAAGVPALGSVQLAPQTAALYSALHEKLAPYITPAGRYMMAFDEMPGVVLALDGRSVGEAWYSASDPDRTAANIRAECASGSGPWGSRLPLLIFSRAPSASEQDALRSCGLSLARDYRVIGPPGTTAGLLVFVPVSEQMSSPAPRQRSKGEQ